MTPDDIRPDKLYPLSEAVLLLPSSHRGKHVHPRTMRRLIQDGRLVPVRRPAGKLHHLFFWGAELLRYLNAGLPPVAVPTSAERRRRQKSEEAEARRRGIL